MELYFEDVLAIRREVVDDGEPAARPHRRTFHVLHLRGRPWDCVGRLSRASLRIAHRQPADGAGRAQISVHESRRHGLDIGNVVETVAHRVGRQKRRDIHVDREQVTDRAGILDPIEPLEGPSAGIRAGGGRLVDHRRQRPSEGLSGPGFRLRRVIRRHHASLQFAYYLLRHFGVLVGVRHVKRLES